MVMIRSARFTEFTGLYKTHAGVSELQGFTQSLNPFTRVSNMDTQGYRESVRVYVRVRLCYVCVRVCVWAFNRSYGVYRFAGFRIYVW